MRKILITIEYFGKNFAGWQCQKDVLSVQGILEEKLSEVLSQNIKIYGSGRTDSGVHALGQKAHFFYEGNLPDFKIASAVNCLLPEDIRVVKSEEIFDENFHAQYSAKSKTYMYKFYVSRTQENDEIIFTINGNGFLYNMVRIIAGTLVWIGLGRLGEDAIEQTFISKSRKNAGKTFPAHGLTLVKVEY